MGEDDRPPTETFIRTCGTQLLDMRTLPSRESNQLETALDEIAGKVGVGDAYMEIKTKVLEAIAEEYDWLWDECWRQEKRMWDRETG